MLSAFKKYLASLNLSPVSRKLYAVDISNFLTSLGAHPSIKLLSSANTYARYLTSLQSSAVAPSMIKRTTASLRQFTAYLTKSYDIPNPFLSSDLLGIRNLSSTFAEKYIKHFTNYLKSLHLSPLTIKSYKSDISLYLDWLRQELPSTELTKALTEKNMEIYLNHLTDSAHTLPSTIDRKSQSLVRFLDWYTANYGGNFKPNNTGESPHTGYEGSPHTGYVTGPDLPQKSVKKSNYRTFISSLWSSPIVPNLASASVRNFLSLGILLLFVATLAIFGYRQFSRDVSLTQAYPSTPVTPNRQISFQGRLENAGGTPITTSTNFVFKLWDASGAGNQLYTSGTCTITPDSDGVFSTQIGDTCGSAIAASVFTENQDVWLEVTVGSETLTPRQQIATVAYALNSETIQGFPISATVSAIRNTVVPMNQWGEIIIGEQSPRMTGVSGTFAISAPALTLSTTTGSSGNITLAPDGTGQVNVQGNTTSTNFFNVSNAQLTTGSLITGTAANNNSGFNLLNLLSGSSPTSKFSVSDAGNVTLAGDLAINGGNITTATTFDSTLTTTGTMTANGTFTANGIVNLGDGGDAITINGSSLVLQTTGAGSDITLNAVDQIILTDFTNGGLGCSALETNTSGFLTCGTDDGGGGAQWWRENLGTLSPVNDTLDLLVGGNATSSAEAGFININSGTPTATVSAGVAGAATLSATGFLGTTALQTLTLGTSTTGNVIIAPGGVTALTAIGNDLTAADDLNLSSAADLIFGGTTSLAETTAANDSGAFLVGTFDEFGYSNSANVQDVLDDLDNQINSLTLGTAGPWTDAGAYMYPTNGEVLGNSAAAGANKIAGLYLGDSSPLVFGTDNDFTFSFNNSASTLGSTLLSGTRLGIGTTSALATVDIRSSLGTIPVASISGNTAMAALVVDQSGIGDIFTASSSGEPRFVVKSNGNVGIGVADPTTKLQIAGTSSTISNSSGNITIDSFGGSVVFGTDDDLIPTLGASTADLGASGTPWDNLYVANITYPSAGSLSIPDNTSSAFRILEGANVYLDITTTDNSETFTLNLPVGGVTSHTANLFNANIAQTINIGTGTAVDTINIGTGGTSTDDINIGGLSTSHTDFTGVVNFAGGTTYFVNASGNANFNDIVASDTGNPGLTVGNGSIGFFLLGGSTLSDNTGDLTIDSDSTKTIISDDLQINGNDILDSGAATRITLGATTTLTNTTTTLSGTTTLTASSLSSFTTAAALAMNSTTSLTLGDNSTIHGGDNASGTLTLSSTSNATQGNIQFFSSSNTLSPTGNLTIAGDLTVNGNDIASAGNLLIAAVGYVRIGDTGTPSTFGDDDDDLYVTGDIELDGDLLVDGGELYLTPLTTSASTTEGTVYYDSDVDKLYVYANGAFQRIATNLTSFSANNASVANGSYVEIAHNSASNDLSAMGWFLDTVSGLYKNITEYSHNIIHNLQNQWGDASYTAFTIDTTGTLRDYLTAYWTLDESSAGSSAVTRGDTYGSNHLTDNNTTASGTGKVGSAADLELTNSEYFEITDNGPLSTGDIDFTVGAWVNLESESAGTTQETIMSKYESGTVGEYRLYYTGATTDRLRFELFNSSGTSVCTVTDTTVVATATWYYVVAWHDATGNTCNIQVNNNTATSAAETGVPSDTAANFRIGAHTTAETAFFDGLVDEASFWKKVLTSTERTNLYNSGSGNTYAGRSGFVRTQTNLTDVSVTPAIDVGTGADGSISITADTVINATNSISGRSCADGGDAVNYSVSSLTSTTATLESTPSTGCLSVGDEVLLINLRGTTGAFSNVGNYETLRIASIASATVTFTTSKTKFYGDNATDDSNIGLSTTNQAVMLQRVPNYTNVTLSNAGTDFTPSDWVSPTGSANNGAGEGGVMFFRATGTVTVAASTTINANRKGYLGGLAATAAALDGGGGGEALCGDGGSRGDGSGGSGSAGGGGGTTTSGSGGNGSCGGGGGIGNVGTPTAGTGSSTSGGSGGGGGSNNTAPASGGGGGFGSAGSGGGGTSNGTSGGTNSSGNGGGGTTSGGGGGGGTYGDAELIDLYFGSAGGGGSSSGFGGVPGAGGDGGGIIALSAQTITVAGNIQSNGGSGGNGTATNSGGGGGGAGGAVLLKGSNITLGTSIVTASAGTAGTGTSFNAGAGGTGRIAVYYASSISGTTSPSATSTFSGYHTYGVYHSPVIETPNAATLESLRWEVPTGTPSGLKKVEFQTRTGNSNNPIDGTWETWKTSATSAACASPNCVSLSNGNTHTEWTGTNVTVADGDVTRNVDMFEDEDEATAGNITKGTSSTNGGTAQDTISSTDFSSYDYVTFWVRASQTGSSLKFGFGESAATEQGETIKIDTADTWQKVYWDLSDIPSAARNAVTLLRFTNLTTASNTFYIDNVQLEKHLTTSNGSSITSTPNNYFQYRIIFTTTNTAYYPSVENIQLLYTDGFKIVQTDTNTVRLYNYTGSTQNLRLEAITFGADLAEWYTVNDPGIAAGDLVSLTGELDEYGVPILRKSSGANDPQLIGAISTKAGQTLGLEADNRRLLALVGRIPVKIDESSPPLLPGDALTSSSVPGLARKAKPGELSFARTTVAWNPGDAVGVLAIVNNTVPTSGIELVDAAIRQIDGVWTTVSSSTAEVIDTVAGFAKIIASQATLADLEVDTISPLASGSAITIQGPVVIREQDIGLNQVALVVEGEIEAATLSARMAKLNEIQADTITARNIVADSIEANSIIGLDAKIATLSAGVSNELTDDELTTITDRIKDRIAMITNPATAADIPVPEGVSSAGDLTEGQVGTAELGGDSLSATSSPTLAAADIDFATINQFLAVVGTATISTLNVTDGLYTDSINSQGGLLALGEHTLVIDSSGSVAINGDVSVTGSLALRAGPESSELGELLTIYNEQGESVATIDASGSANLASLTTQLITIAAGTDATSSGLLTSSTSSNATAGVSILTTQNTELTIESPYVTGDTLVYLTPTGYTQNKVLYVKSKESCTLSAPNCTPSFTVAIDTPAQEDIPFNWWIIKLQNNLGGD